MVREGRVLISSVGDPDFGADYYVTAYEVGAVVASGSSGTTITVDAGHGFATNDKFIVLSEFPAVTKYRTVTGTGATSLTVAAVTVSAGDILINLAQDTGVPSPEYDGNGLAIYTDMDYGSQAADNTVQTDSNGRYRYYYNNIPIWELVRSAISTPFTAYLDTGLSGVGGSGSSTDNAVVRYDGTTGATLQNSVVLISDSGATSGITTLAASGAVTFSSTLAIGGALTGVTTLNASGLVAAGANLTVGTTLGVTGTSTLAAVVASGLVAAAAAVTVGTTLTVTGATTTTGGITGGIPRNCGTWSITAVTNGTSISPNANTLYHGSIFVPANVTITGVQYMRGIGAVGTTKVIVTLHSAAGVLLRSSATAGTAIGTLSQLHRVDFTSTYAAVGPAWYFIGVNFDTASADVFRAIPPYCNAGNGVVGDSIAQTFGTPTTLTPIPTLMADNKVPVASIY